MPMLLRSETTSWKTKNTLSNLMSEIETVIKAELTIVISATNAEVHKFTESLNRMRTEASVNFDTILLETAINRRPDSTIEPLMFKNITAYVQEHKLMPKKIFRVR